MYARQGISRHSLHQNLTCFLKMNIKTAAQQAVLRACSRKNVIFLSHSLVIDNKRGARNEQNANRRSCGRDSFNRFKRSGTTVPEGYQLQQVLMMSRHNLRAPLATMAVCWSSRRRINGQNGTSPVGNSPPKVACSKCIWAITCVNGWQSRGW